MNIRKTTSIILVLIMILTLSFTLLSCGNKPDRPTEAELYKNAVQELKLSVMSAKNADWSKNFTDEELAKRSDASEYVLYGSGLDFLSNSFKNAGLVSGQIDALTELFKKEEVKELFKKLDDTTSAKDRSDKFFKVFLPLLNQDFTANDIGNILYNILYDLSNNVGPLFHSIWVDLYDVYNLTTDEKNKAKILDVAQMARNIDKYFSTEIPSNKDKKELLLQNIKSAEKGIKGLGEFAYNVLFNSLYDKLASFMGNNGVLQDISENEIKLTYKSILTNFKDFRKVLTDEELSNLNIAFENIINTFSSIMLGNSIISSSSDVITSIISYISVAYFSIDLLPTLCDVVIASEELIDNDKNFLTQIHTLVTNTEYNIEANKYIMLSKILGNYVTKSIKDSDFVTVGTNFLNGLFDKVDTIKDPSMKMDKQIGIMGVDMLFALYKLELQNDPQAQIEETRGAMLAPLLAYMYYKELRTNYNGAKAGIVLSGHQGEGPYQAAYKEYSKNHYLENILKFNPPILSDTTEEEYGAYLRAVLAIVEEKDIYSTTYKYSVFNYIGSFYESAKQHLINDLTYVKDELALTLFTISNYNLVTKNSTNYQDVVNELAKLNIIVG